MSMQSVTLSDAIFLRYLVYTISTFRQLPYTEKINMIYKDGVYVGKRKTRSVIVVLYQVQHFYIEIVYTKYRKNIASLNVTDCIDILTPYLEQIDVKELIAAY